MLTKLMIGDVFDRMLEIPDASIDLIVTSPPFLNLREYLPGTHPDKDREVGQEPGPTAFITTMLWFAAEARRVLAPHGSMVVELGDSYSIYIRRQRSADWPAQKSLALIPELFRVGLAYERHPLTGEPSPAGEWLIRNVVRRCNTTPPTGRVGDRFRTAVTDLVVAALDPLRYFDEDAVRSPAVPRDWIVIPPGTYRGAHYATWPEKLLPMFIAAMTPRRVCLVCGEPSRRIVETERWRNGRRLDPSDGYFTSGRDVPADSADWGKMAGHRNSKQGVLERRVTSESWSECPCPDPESGSRWRNGMVLDPFAGTGTTAAIANGHGFDATLIDLDERNAALIEQRVGRLWLERVEPAKLSVQTERQS